ncbi:adhesion G protein-coupled receptor E3-like isoform X2 [Engraulis encrasicolus]
MSTLPPLLVFLLLGPGLVECVIQVSGYVGGSALISCGYERGYERNSKYLCPGHCSLLGKTKVPIKTQEGMTNATAGRLSLHDNRASRIFTVNISGLTWGDEGKYWCGVEIDAEIDKYTEVYLHIRDAPVVTSAPPVTTAPVVTRSPPVTADPAVALRGQCKETDVECMLKFINSTSTAATLPLKVVSSLLDVLLDAPAESLVSRGEAVLLSSENLVSKLVEPTHNTSGSRFRTNSTEGEILSIGPDASLSAVPQLTTPRASLHIDLPGIARNNNGSASVVLMVYSSMQEILNASFFKMAVGQEATAMSSVMSVVLPNASNKTLPNPANLTIFHPRSAGHAEEVSCVYWNVTSWIQDGCHVSATNSTHTVCSCNHLSTFALIVSIDPKMESDPVVEVLNTILVLIGLVFLALAGMTFVLCRWNPRVSNVARLNLCVCLFLAHALFLLTQTFRRRIRFYQTFCKTMAGVLHFLYMCSFVWMSIEAVMLFLSVRKLRQVKPSERAWLHWKVSLPIGYGIPLIIVAVSSGVWSDGYGSDKCWLKGERGFLWSFLGPVFFILTSNIILFIIILITIHATLKDVRSDVSKVKYTRVLVFKVIAQCIVLGCPWILGIFSSYSSVLEVLFIFLMSQQGTVIFLIHCLLNTEVRRQYRSWWQKFRPYANLTTESSSGSGTASVSVTLQPPNATSTSTISPTTTTASPTISFSPTTTSNASSTLYKIIATHKVTSTIKPSKTKVQCREADGEGKNE